MGWAECFLVLIPAMTSKKIVGTICPGKKSFPCPEARVLLERYSEAVSESLMVLEIQFQSVIAADADSNRFDLIIHEANEKRENAKYAYLNHQHSHGCAYQPLGSLETRADGQPRLAPLKKSAC
jgi:hypothetical protein